MTKIKEVIKIKNKKIINYVVFLLLLTVGLSIGMIQSSPVIIQFEDDYSATHGFENENQGTVGTAINFLDCPKSSSDYTFEAGWWKFDETSGHTAYDSVGDNNGTLDSNMTDDDWVPGKLGNALDFDGDLDQVDVLDYNLPNSGYTMACWFKTTRDHLAWVLCEGEHGESVATNANMMTIKDTDEIMFWTETGSGINHQYPFTITGATDDGQWHFLAAVVDSGALTMWFDDQKFTTSIVNSDTTADNFRIGNYRTLPSYDANRFVGQIDDVRVYELLLTDEEIAWLYNNGSGRAEKLNEHNYNTSRWKFDETSGNIAYNSIGDNNGILNADMTDDDWVPGKLGNALDFDGDYDQVDMDYNLPNSGYTMACWFKTNRDHLAWVCGEGEDGESVATNVNAMGVGDTDGIFFWTETGSGINHQYHFTITGATDDGQWHFIAAVVDSGALTMWFDDQKFNSSIINSDTTANNFHVANYRTLASYDANRFVGQIDDVRVYELLLTDNDIAWIYNNGMGSVPPEITINSPTPSEAVGSTAPTYDVSITGLYDSIWYTFDGGATNYSANSLTGTLNQVAWSALPDGAVTITFFTNYSIDLVGSAQVFVIKDTTDEPPPAPQEIPGYDLYLLIGTISVISALLIRKRSKS